MLQALIIGYAADDEQEPLRQMSPSMLSPFHLAIPVQNLAEARLFYREALGCAEGRSSERWVDFNFFGHQLVIHEVDSGAPAVAGSNPVDGETVPVPHFGVVLNLSEWRALAQRLTKRGQTFVIAPHIRFRGEPGEQGTFFLHDPSGNALEFKGFTDVAGQLFKK